MLWFSVFKPFLRIQKTITEYQSRTLFLLTGIAFVAVYIFLIIFATLQTRSAANAPKSQLGGYSTSNYGWEVTYFNTFDFIDAPKTLGGRLTNGKNIKNTGRYGSNTCDNISTGTMI